MTNCSAASERQSRGAESVPLPHAPALDAGQELFFPMHQRVIVQYSGEAEDGRQLHLYYGDKEITFEDPSLFKFGESLARQSRFVAGSAIAWGDGQSWQQVREMLENLLAEGILEHAATPASTDHAPQRPGVDRGACPSPLPPATTSRARTWSECQEITTELAGRGLEIGYLELVMPVFRIAHIVVDAEGRQVGEANVFPKALRLDVPTRWRTCIYPGSRYQDPRPMNVSALKSMRAHWPQMMAMLLQVRRSYLERFPDARNGWTVGDVERLSTLVLTLPTYLLMKSAQPVANGELHPVLSSMFRVADGLRMTTHQMLFVPVSEATLAPDSPVTCSSLYDYAERNYAFASTHGVCAGPRAMIEEFMAVLIDGKVIDGASDAALDVPLQQALAALEAANDYGLLGLQAHAVIFSLWPVMTRAYVQLAQIAEQWSGPMSPALEQFRTYLQGKNEILKNETLHATEAWRTNRENVYADIYAHCGAGLGHQVDQPLTQRIAPVRGNHAHLESTLRALLGSRFGIADTENNPDITLLSNCLMNFFLQSQAILGLGCEIQDRINTLLGRVPPQRDFTVADIDIHVLLQGSEARRLPYLVNELEAQLGFRVDITRQTIVVSQVNEFLPIE